MQTEDQYIFIHDAILEAINCGNTELSACNLYSHLHKLTTPENGNPITAMELEFKVRIITSELFQIVLSVLSRLVSFFNFCAALLLFFLVLYSSGILCVFVNLLARYYV